jgi:hypothetical protein
MPKYTPEQQARIDAANAKMREKEARKRATGSMRLPSRTEGRFASRKALMDFLGAEQANTYWAWCGVAHAERKVYFSMWTNTREEKAGVVTYTVQGPDWGVDDKGRKNASRSDHDKKLAMVLNDGYEAWGYLIEQDDRAWERDHITKIEATVTNRIYQLRLAVLQDGSVQGVVTNEVQLKI